MRHTWRLATRNWWVNPGRTIASVLSVTLGVATIAIIVSFYATARTTIIDEVMNRWLGAAHLSIQPAGAHWGSLDVTLVDPVSSLPNVQHVIPRLQRRMFVPIKHKTDQTIQVEGTWVDAIGIDPSREVQAQSLPGLQGRSLAVDDRNCAVLEQGLARDTGVALGDSVSIALHRGGKTVTVAVVGTFESQRLADFQNPVVYLNLIDLQTLRDEPGVVTSIDIQLHDFSQSAIAAAKQAAESLIADRGDAYRYKVESAAAAMGLLEEADHVTRWAIAVTSVMAMLTAFFIILTTMSMSLNARTVWLGTMRCVGLTRGQLAWLLLIEVLPLGIAGTLVGLPLGAYIAHELPDWMDGMPMRVTLPDWGILLGVGCGCGTALISWVFLLFQIARVTPLAATTPHARPPKKSLAFIAFAVGIGLIGYHEWLVARSSARPIDAASAWISLVFGFALIVPLFVMLIAPHLAKLLARLLRISPKLAYDQVAASPWRGTGACWVLLVGMSFIVYTAISASVLRSIWDFPGRLPEAFVWSPQYVPYDAVDRVRRLPGVARCTSVTDVSCEIEVERPSGADPSESFIASLLRKFTRPVFVAGEPDRLLAMMKVGFVEGSMQDAMPKLQRGGHILIPVQTAKHHKLHLDDRVKITVENRSAEFIVAGVIQSPPLDLAVTAFQATSYMQFAAASAMLGTHSDLREKFGLDVVSMMMCDLSLDDTFPPAMCSNVNPPDASSDRAIARTFLDWGPSIPEEHDEMETVGGPLRSWLETEEETPLPAELAPALRRFGRVLTSLSWSWERQSPQERWARLRERLVMLRIAGEMDRLDAIIGSLRQLKQEVDKGIRRATLLATWMPGVGLVVSSIGIANLLMVSVQTRSRQLAMLRAVGASQSQIMRLILCEAIVLGLLGSLAGIALGFYDARSDMRIVERTIGFVPEFTLPIETILLGAALTVTVCILAGLGPARFAARSNVVAALQNV
ncbi:MAG: FtsX-like permease family protein [Planctomycetota bacterium]